MVSLDTVTLVLILIVPLEPSIPTGKYSRSLPLLILRASSSLKKNGQNSNRKSGQAGLIKEIKCLQTKET